jgi:hypothetical protein
MAVTRAVSNPLDMIPVVSEQESSSSNALTEEQVRRNKLEQTILDSILNVANKPSSRPKPVQEEDNKDSQNGGVLFYVIFLRDFV